MDLGPLAGITIVDVYVVGALAALALAMWIARRYVGWLLQLVPVVLAMLGTLTAYGAWRLGEQLHWDTPGSPGLLAVYFALGGGAVFAVAGWIAVALRVRRWRMPDRRRNPRRGDNAIRVAIAIVLVVGALFSAYRYYRSHQSSHEANVVRLTYSPDGAFLYSLDESGVLKKWNARHHFEVRRWQLPEIANVASMLASGDGATLVTLAESELKSWGLSAAPEALPGASLADVVAVAPVGGAELVAVSAHEVSLRAYADIATPKGVSTLKATALSASACSERKVVVGTDDSKLHFYAVTSRLDEVVAESLPPLQTLPSQIRADRSGTFVAVSDGDKKMVVLDLQNNREDAVAQYWLPAKFEISGAGELLLGQVGITGYELATRSTEPIFNHGGAITALAVSPHADDFAIANRHEIWLRANSRDYAVPEVWLNGRAELPLGPLRLTVAALFGGAAGY
jgi:WD40 repeat protein